MENGRLRHFALPHALEALRGAVQFDARGVTLDGLTGRLGNGSVQFFGRIDKDGYLPGRLDVTMTGQGMRLRFPEGCKGRGDCRSGRCWRWRRGCSPLSGSCAGEVR